MDLTALHDPGFGSAHAILGPMTSGKSDELMRRLDRFRRMRNASVHMYKPRLVDEASLFPGMVHSRTGAQWPATVVSTSLEILNDVIGKREEIGKNKIVVIGVDEAQFVVQLAVLLEIAKDRRILTSIQLAPEKAQLISSWTMIVFFAALDGTFEQKPWPEISNAIPHCLSIEKLRAVCVCCQLREAPFSRREILSEQLVLIEQEDAGTNGKAEKYVASCAACLTHAGRRCCDLKEILVAPATKGPSQ